MVEKSARRTRNRRIPALGVFLGNWLFPTQLKEANFYVLQQI